jgi:hypothetical protein
MLTPLAYVSRKKYKKEYIEFMNTKAEENKKFLDDFINRKD